jgi:hypothetical protein
MENEKEKQFRQQVARALKTKSVHKQDVFYNTTEWFGILKEVLAEVQDELCNDMEGCDARVVVKFTDKGNHEADFQIAGDLLIFHMHTNVFRFDDANPIWQMSYMENRMNGFCGIINVYNFLTDSLKYHRENDAGYLIARIFINANNHFMVQGKNELSLRFGDFGRQVLTREILKDVVYAAFAFTLEFDLFVPPIQAVREVSVFEIQQLSDHLKLRTGKRMGFQFSADKGEMEF